MSQKITNDAGEEIEVFTADEVTAREEAARTTVKGEFEPKISELTEKLTDAEKRAQERAGEFATFRKLSDEAVAKLSVAERTIYENQKLFDEERRKNAEGEETRRKATVDGILRQKAGTDEKLFNRMKEMYELIGVIATTPEEIEKKTLMVLGALKTTEPDLVANVAGFSGSFAPPALKTDTAPSFADTPEGKAGAAELGLTLEPPKKA